MFIARERLVHLLDRAIKFVEQRDVHHRRVQPFDEAFADVITRQQSNRRDQCHGEQQRQRAPIPEHSALAIFRVRDGFGDEK